MSGIPKKYVDKELLSARVSVETHRALNRFCLAENKIKARVLERAIINYLADNDPDYDVSLPEQAS